MKKTLLTTAVVALSSAFMVSCQKEANQAPETNIQTVTFNASDIQTKTVFGDKNSDGAYPTLWTENDAVAVSYNFNTAKPKKAEVTPSANRVSASFSAEFEPQDTSRHNFYAVSPYSAVISVAPKYKDFKLAIPTAQTPGENTCDPAAQLIVAKHESTTFDDDIILSFSHLTAYGNLSLNLSDLNVGTIKTVSLTASKNIAGQYYYYPADGKLEEVSASKTITLTTDKNSDIFFACTPVDLSNGSLNITITTTEGDVYEKDIDLTEKSFEFKAGRISKFTVGGFTKNEEVGLSLPFEDDFSWQTGGSNEDNITDKLQSLSKNFTSANTLFSSKTAGEIRIGKSGGNGSITTTELDLSKDFYVEIEAKAYNTDDNANLVVSVGNQTQTAETVLSDRYTTFAFNFSATTKSSPVTISTNKKRAVITYVKIAEGTYTPTSKLSISPETATVACNTTDYKFTISSNTKWNVSTTADWAMAMTESGEGDGSVEITLDQNTTTSSRAAEFIVETEDKTVSKTFTLTQKAFEPVLTIDKTSDTVAANAEEYTLNVTSNTNWTMTADVDWVAFTESGKGNANVEIIFDANTSSEARTAVFTITTTDGSISKTFTLTQKAAGAAEIIAGKSYDGTLTSNPFSSTKKTAEINDILWTLDTDNAGYYNYDNGGIHLGSGSKSISYATFTLDYNSYCNNDSANGVTLVKIKCKAAGSNPTVELWVGTEKIGTAQNITNTMSEYTFTVSPMISGNVIVKISQTSAKKAIYIGGININPSK